MIYTTLNHIREHNPCPDGWRKLLTHLGKTEADDAPLAYSTILESNGFGDALWCLRAEPQHAGVWRMYAVRCARRVQHLMEDERNIQALDVAERHARGAATDEELAAARDAAWDAIRADFERMLAAHHAMPGESCALVDWWAGGKERAMNRINEQEGGAA